MVGRGSPNCQSPKPTVPGVGHVLPIRALATHSSIGSRQCGAPTTFLSWREKQLVVFMGGVGEAYLAERLLPLTSRELWLQSRLCPKARSPVFLWAPKPRLPAKPRQSVSMGQATWAAPTPRERARLTPILALAQATAPIQQGPSLPTRRDRTKGSPRF